MKRTETMVRKLDQLQAQLDRIEHNQWDWRKNWDWSRTWTAKDDQCRGWYSAATADEWPASEWWADKWNGWYGASWYTVDACRPT